MPDQVTFSRNVFLPITNVCRNRCGYCGFRRDPSHPEANLMGIDEVRRILEEGTRFRCTEALFTFGEMPEEHPIFKDRINELGYSSVIDYLIELCEIAIKCGLLPHSNPGVLSFHDLKRLRPVNASMGLMLETTAILPAHEGSPGKIPSERIRTIRDSGRLKIPFTTGLLIGIGESMEDRIESLTIVRDLHLKYGHIQEVIIQPFAPKPDTAMADFPEPSDQEIVDTVTTARRILPGEITIQVPPNLTGFSDLIRCGASDLGGISPYTIDWINPEAKWPMIAELERELGRIGIKLKERLPIYPQYVLNRWYDQDHNHDFDFDSASGLADLIERYSDEEGFRNGD
ncbi:MAG: 7,8-didemethyl-8-hydroxy-5-deazariboflavin synthase subunit CofG [Candidatus Methanogasteraceae archaeon]